MVNNDLTISSNILKALNENGYELYIDDDRQQFIDSY
jgi:hypothetical protein